MSAPSAKAVDEFRTSPTPSAEARGKCRMSTALSAEARGDEQGAPHAQS